ncbi:MAG: carboxypeptidase regulatory-like domain-containing protein [Bacteroidales bacterium]|nr:carboxypeptidase regulatory-like domain-containing protein [Bacteroidales bacterium]
MSAHKTFITTILLLFSHQVLHAQTSISGFITTLDSIPISHVNLVLCHNDTIISGTTTNLNGEFIFTNVKANNYTLKIHHLEYLTKTFDVSIFEDKPIALGTIELEPFIQELETVEIIDKSSNRFGDKQIYYPTAVDRESSSALDMISLVPKFVLEPSSQQLVTVKGDQVKILINGISATETDLLLITPENISRVEYYDNPPARYSLIGVGAVVNIITKQSIMMGGQIAMNLQNSVNKGHGNDLVGMKYNLKNSQFGLKYRFRYKNQNERIVNESLFYHFDNIENHKIKTGENSPFKLFDHLIDFDFTNQKPDNYIFNAKISLMESEQKIKNRQNIEQIKPININENAYNEENNNYLSPVADVYFEKKIKDRQSFLINVVGTYYDAEFSNNYSEFTSQDTVFKSFVNVLSSKYSAISDALYTYSWKNNNLTGGVRYMYAKAIQDVSTENTEKLSSQTQELYGYTQLIGRISNFSYSVSAGVNYSEFDSYELSKEYSFIYFRPDITLYYTKGNSEFSLSSQINTYNPVLSELSHIPVMQDTLFAYSGNPDLKPYNKYFAALSYEYSRSKFYLWTNISFDYATNPILPYFNVQPAYILQTYANLDCSKEYALSIFTQWFPFESKWMRLRLSGTVFKTINENSDVVWSQIGYRIIPSCIMKYKKWGLSLFYQSYTETLKGQLLKNEPSFTSVELSYKPINSMSLIAGVRNPFYPDRKYETKTQDISFLSRYSSETIRDNSNLIYLQFVYTLSFGKQMQNYEKKLQNQDIDSGIFKLQ